MNDELRTLLKCSSEATILHLQRENNRLQELAYLYPPSEPFNPDGVTYKQELDEALELLRRATTETIYTEAEDFLSKHDK